MSAFVSLKPELSKNGMGAQWDSRPGTSDDSANLNPFDAQMAQVADSLKKEGRFPTPSATTCYVQTTRISLALMLIKTNTKVNIFLARLARGCLRLCRIYSQYVESRPSMSGQS